MNVLVTGGAGYIGSHTCVELIEAGHTPIVIDNLSNSNPESLHRVAEITGKTVEFIEGDVRDEALLEKIFAEHEISCAIHFAGLKAVENAPSMMPPSEPRLNWLAENITQTDRPVKMIGIIEARMSVRRLKSNFVPLRPMRNSGPTSSCLSASPVAESFAAKLFPSADRKISSVATSSAIRMASRPRITENRI